MSGWLTGRVPRIQTQDHAQSHGGLSETAGALATNRKRCFGFFTGAVYRGAALPPSMLRAKGAAIYYSASGRKTCSTNADPVVPLVHYCRFIIGRPKERHAFEVLRSGQTQSRGEADALRCFRTGTQTDTVQPGTQEQIPDTFWGLPAQFESQVCDLITVTGQEV